MRSSIFLTSTLLALAAAQDESSSSTILDTDILSTDQSATLLATTIETLSYSNPNTQYLTQTDSNGVITGQPSVITDLPTAITSQPAVVTSQPDAASIYAGLSQGFNTVVVGNRTLTVDVNGNMTSVLTSTSPSSSDSFADATATSNMTASLTGATSSPGATGLGDTTNTGSASSLDVLGGMAKALIGACAVFAIFL